MSIIIKTRKEVLSSGVEGRRIKKIMALKKDQLPLVYFNFPEHVWLSNKDDILFTGSKKNVWQRIFEVDCFYEENDFQDQLKFVKMSGDRLKCVNDQLKEMRRNWKGKETFVI